MFVKIVKFIAACSTIVAGGASADVFISEFHYDNVGTDDSEAIEISAPPNTDLTGWSLVLYNGKGGVAYNKITSLDKPTFVETCNSAYTVINLPTNGLQNGAADGIALVDNFGTVIEFISYEGVVVATSGPAADMASNDIGVAETSSTPIGFSLQKVAGKWLPPAANTFGSCTQTIEEPPVQATLISTIQGAGDTVTTTNPVIVEAIVTATYLGSTKLNGFYIQEEDADSDSNPLTSEGIFVYCPSCSDLSTGDRVTVIGTPGEYFGLSQITAQSVTLVSHDNPLPSLSTISLPIPFSTTEPSSAMREVNAFFEARESMRVEVSTPMVVTETYNLARYGELLLAANQRFRQFTDSHLPTSDGFALHQVHRAANVLVLDDGSNVQNPEMIPYPQPGFAADNILRGGDTLTSLGGILSFGFSQWRVEPEFAQFSYEFQPTNPRHEPPLPAGSGPIIASFNVLNYFTTLDQGQAICGPNKSLDCRGANSADELQRQTAKLSQAICAMNADIIGLMELENSPNDKISALTTLVNSVNQLCGGYSAIETGPVGSDAITVGIMYRAGKVTAVGDTAILDEPSFVNPNQSSIDKNRPAIAQSFADTSSGENFTLVVNHLKSKGSDCNDSVDPSDDDLTRGQGNCNGTRTQAALAEMNWLGGYPTGIITDKVLVIGDLNAYRNEDPITAFKTAGFTDLVDFFGGEQSYSYVYDGEWGYLDHALASIDLVPHVVAVKEWHINSDEVRAQDYNDEFKPNNYLNEIYTESPYRTSDHDPILIQLEFEPAPPSRNLADILAAYNVRISNNSITGAGRFWLLQTLNELLFKALLQQAQKLEKQGATGALCSVLHITQRRSDGLKSPIDLIQGAGVADINLQLSRYEQNQCQ